MDPIFAMCVGGGCIHTPHTCVNAAVEKETDYDRTNSYLEFPLLHWWTGNGDDYSCNIGVYIMNEFDQFMATLDIMAFHLNNGENGSIIVSKWTYELNQILKMYKDMCQINSGNLINKTTINDDPYYGKEGPK